MSPIGRVFIVINLALAGGFVVLAGTFLQRHTDYKAQFEAKSAELTAAEKSFNENRDVLSDQISTLERELRGHKSSLDTAETQNKALQDENLRLKGQLDDLAGDVKSLNSRATTMAEAVDRSTADARQAYEMAMKATEERDRALQAKEDAETKLSDAARQIQTLEGSVAEANGSIADLRRTTEEQQVLLELVKRRAPGILAMAQPDLRGVVEQATGNICTVRLTDNPGNVDVKPGYTMAIYKSGTYKGEAVITEVDGEFAFCRVTKTVRGMSVAAGDAAATNVGF